VVSEKPFMPPVTCCYCGTRIAPPQPQRKATAHQLQHAADVRRASGKPVLPLATHICSSCNRRPPSIPPVSPVRCKVHKGITICIMSETHTDSFKTVYCLCTLHLTNVQVQKQIPAASSVPRRALSDITNLLHPLQDASPPRRTKSIDDDEGRPLHSRMSPLQRWGSVVLTQVGFKATEVIPVW
jgi:hypothetical protein